MAYNFTETLTEGNWTIKIDRAEQYGYFEHNEGGEGGLWFDTAFEDGSVLELMDYDGFTHLPKGVITALRRAGYVVGPEFD